MTPCECSEHQLQQIVEFFRGGISPVEDYLHGCGMYWSTARHMQAFNSTQESIKLLKDRWGSKFSQNGLTKKIEHWTVHSSRILLGQRDRRVWSRWVFIFSLWTHLFYAGNNFFEYSCKSCRRVWGNDRLRTGKKRWVEGLPLLYSRWQSTFNGPMYYVMWTMVWTLMLPQNGAQES